MAVQATAATAAGLAMPLATPPPARAAAATACQADRLLALSDDIAGADAKACSALLILLYETWAYIAMHEPAHVGDAVHAAIAQLREADALSLSGVQLGVRTDSTLPPVECLWYLAPALCRAQQQLCVVYTGSDFQCACQAVLVLFSVLTAVACMPAAVTTSSAFVLLQKNSAAVHGAWRALAEFLAYDMQNAEAQIHALLHAIRELADALLAEA